MKKNFIKVGFMLGLALVTTASLNSCASEEEDASGENTEQSDSDNDADQDDNEPDMDEDEGNEMTPEMDSENDTPPPAVEPVEDEAPSKTVESKSMDRTGYKKGVKTSVEEGGTTMEKTRGGGK